MRWIWFVLISISSTCDVNTCLIKVRGRPIYLLCVDDELDHLLKTKYKGKKRQFWILRKNPIDDQLAKVFVYSVKADGSVDENSKWTDIDRYLPDKFTTSVDGNGINIRSLTLDDGGDYTCRISVSHSTFTKDLKFNIEVQVVPILSEPVTKVLVENFRTNYKEFGHCTAENSKPASKVRWEIPESISGKDFIFDESEAEDSHWTITTKSVLKLVPRKKYDGEFVRCIISHAALPGGSKTYEMKITVEYPPSEPIITPYFKSNLLYCESDGNPNPTLSWTWYPTLQPSQRKDVISKKLEIPNDGTQYNFSCIASNQHGTNQSTVSSLILERQEKFLEANLNIIVVSGIATLVALILIAFCVCRHAIKSSKHAYKNRIPLPTFPLDGRFHLQREESSIFRPTPPTTKPPHEITESDADDTSFGDDVEIGGGAFIRSHSILQESHHEYNGKIVSDGLYGNNHIPKYDYRPTSSCQIIPVLETEIGQQSAFSPGIDNVLHSQNSQSPIDARRCHQSSICLPRYPCSSNYHTKPQHVTGYFHH